MTEVSKIVGEVEDSDAEIRTKFDRALSGSAKYFAWAIFVAFLISIVEVISRYVFNSPTFWAHETTSFLIAAVFLIGGPMALARDKHIRVRIIYDAVNTKWKRILDIVNSIIALVFFGGLAFAGWTMVQKSWFTPTGDLHLEGTGTSWNPPTPALLKLLVLICVGVMMVQSLLHLIEAIRRDVTTPSDSEGGE